VDSCVSVWFVLARNQSFQAADPFHRVLLIVSELEDFYI
jgi:hypothetical protein